MPPKPSIPSERLLLANYKLWRKYVDPDGLVSASEFREMDDDEKREALRELGGAHPAEPGAADAIGSSDDEEEEEVEEVEPEGGEGGEGDDRFVDLSDDIVDPRSE